MSQIMSQILILGYSVNTPEGPPCALEWAAEAFLLEDLQ